MCAHHADIVFQLAIDWEDPANSICAQSQLCVDGCVYEENRGFGRRAACNYKILKDRRFALEMFHLDFEKKKRYCQ